MQKLTGLLNLSRIPKDLIGTNKNGEKTIFVDIVANKNGADQYGNTHTITIWDKTNRKTIYLANLKPQEVGGTQAPVANVPEGKDDLPW